MPLVFFSGGIDSTALAFDLATRPYRYGVTVREDTELLLVTAVSRQREVAATKMKLHLLVAALRRVATYTIRHEVLVDGLTVEEALPLPKGGTQSLNPILSQYSPDIEAIPYTPGWMLWMAAVAVNQLAAIDQDQEYNPQQAFIAHQWNGPVWRAIEAGGLTKFDSMPVFYESLQKTISLCGPRVLLRCPFLENRMNRAMIVQLALELGVPLGKTSSCSVGWMKKCGACAPCLLRQAAFKTLGVRE